MGPRKKARTAGVEEAPKPGEGSTETTKPENITTDDHNDVTKSTEVPSSPLKDSKSRAGPSEQVSQALSPPLAVQVHPSIMTTDPELKIKAKSSWYGTWPRKSTPSTQIARENILADKPANGSLVDLSRFEQKKPSTTTAARPPSMYLGKSKETLDISMGGTLEGTIEEEDSQRSNDTRPEQQPLGNEVLAEDQPKADEKSTSQIQTDQPAPPEVATVNEGPTSSDTASLRRAKSSGWLGGWLGRPPLEPSDTQQKPPEDSKIPEPLKVADEPPAPTVSPVAEATSEEASKSTVVPTTSSSWFGLWSNATPSTASEAPKEQVPVKIAKEGDDTVMEDAPPPRDGTQQSPQPPTQQAAPAAGSSWAFWSTDTSKKAANSSQQLVESGKLAVVGEASQNSPELAKTAAVKENKKKISTKRVRPVSVEIDDATQRAVQSSPSSSKSPAATSVVAKPSPPNLLIPSVKNTYRLAESPGILQQIARLLSYGKQQPPKHVFLVKEPPKIKKALAIGIHGLFPAAILRTVIGQPTGTSIRFANHGAAAIRRWTEKNGSVDCEIEKIALEGEGKIGERVDNLWKLLLNWIDHVRQADFILVSCHSQGVPVALMLIAKLIEFGVVTTGRIGVCAMAGVSLGPFADYKSKLFSGSAGELFEFADPESIVSKRYEDSLRVAMHYGVRITYCGSIDDQLVSMESAIFSPASHPYIYRTVFVDGRIHAPDFLSHLVGFALKLRNLGVPDHGLIRELSAPLAGSLYTGEGHSRLYDECRVYDFAIEFALETTSVGDVPLSLKKYEIPTNSNPYVLPWIMRGLLEEDFVKTELDREVSDLLKQFDDWKPATKVLKDVKYRLEAVRSKL